MVTKRISFPNHSPPQQPYPKHNSLIQNRISHHLLLPRCCSTDSSYEILEAPNNLFNTIEVSPEMLTDHLPDTLVTLLKDLQPLDVSAGDDIQTSALGMTFSVSAQDDIQCQATALRMTFSVSVSDDIFQRIEIAFQN